MQPQLPCRQPRASSSSAPALPASPPPPDRNAAIHAALVELGETEKVKGDQMKANTYFKAARAVRAYGQPITSGKQARKDAQWEVGAKDTSK